MLKRMPGQQEETSSKLAEREILAVAVAIAARTAEQLLRLKSQQPSATPSKFSNQINLSCSTRPFYQSWETLVHGGDLTEDFM
ncbi:hypothetical protein NC651_015094 [Populus alba x Populus x berolinensis]|nr:hypothetical protein NC651_015094 [Populus alba x Populus x berolinensis]